MNNLSQNAQEFLDQNYSCNKAVSWKLEKLRFHNKWVKLKVQDFDDTLYSRLKSLEVLWLKNNRWDDWNVWILAKYSGILDSAWESIFWWKGLDIRDSISLNTEKEEFTTHISKEYSVNLLELFVTEVREAVAKMNEWDVNNNYQKFVKDFYWDKSDWENILWLVKNIQELIYSQEDGTNLILTAWNEILQKEKIDAVKIDCGKNSNIDLKIVEKSSQKIKELIDYILEIWYIPEQIDIYEDRPEYFIEYGKVLAELFWTKINVHKVMINNENNADILESRHFNYIY